MINQVSSYESKKNPFGIVSNHNSATDYWLKESNSSENKTDDFTINDILTPEKARKTHNLEAIGISIAGTVIAISGVALLLLKGGPKGFAKAIEKLRLHYIEKLQNAKINDKTAKHTEFILSKLNSLLQKGEAVNNLTTMKDYAFKRFMYLLKPTRKVHQKITGWFEKLGLRTVELSYGETASELLHTSDINTKLLNKINSGNLNDKIKINGETLTKKEWFEKLKKLTQEVRMSFDEHFGNDARKIRLDKMRKNARELEKSFNQKGDLWFLSKDTFKSFVAEQNMHTNKMNIQTPINNIKKGISYTTQDLLKESSEKITKISSMINFGEKDTLNALNNLKKDLKSFAEPNSAISKEKIIEDIDKMLQEFSKATKPSDKNRLSVVGEFNDLKVSIINYEQGKIEEILDIYKALLPEKDFNEIKKSYSKVIKSLDKSIKLETEEFVNKLRDLTMGSAPTDILTNLIGVGTLAYYLGKSDDKEQRMGIALKYGFPALTLIGMGLYGNAKLFAGSKSLAFGIISSAIVNRIGTAANDILQKHFEKKNNISERQPQTKIN